MKVLIVSTAFAAALAVAPAQAQQSNGNLNGKLTAPGASPSDVLGSIDTSKLVDNPPPSAEAIVPEPGVTPAQVARLDQKTVTRSTVVEGTKETGATVTTTEVVKPVAAPKQFPDGSEIAPEVKAAYDAGHRKTRDLIAAQLAAVQNAPIPQPTTVITTRVTTPPQPAASEG